MAAAASGTSGNVFLNFCWHGPTNLRGGSFAGGQSVHAVDLVFQNSKSSISVCLPYDLSPSGVQRLNFEMKKVRMHIEPPSSDGQTGYEVDVSVIKTHPETLKVTIEKIRHLELIAYLLESHPQQANTNVDEAVIVPEQVLAEESISLKVPEDLIVGETYTLMVTSQHDSLSAEVVKADAAKSAETGGSQAGANDFKQQVGAFGKALIEEGVRNIVLVADGAGGASATSADAFQHGMHGIIRAAQETLLPDIQVPQGKPVTTAADLKGLSTEQLQTRFNETCTLDKQYETQRINAAAAGNKDELSKIIALEVKNSQLLILLGEELEQRGAEVVPPESAAFNAAHNEEMKKICKQQ